MNRLSEILQNAQAFSDKVALVDTSGARVRYAQMISRSQQMATVLTNAGIRAGDRVGVLAPKSAEVVSAFLAISSLEAAYIPVDANAPMNRNAYILADCQVKAVLVEKDLVEAISETSSFQFERNELLEFNFDLLLCQYEEEKKLDFPSDLAYMLYTSGSTGMPKGVMISHRNALSFIEWGVEQFKVTSEDVISSIAPFHFDLSVFDLYVSLSQGATLVLLNQKMAKNPLMLSTLIEENKVTIIYATPTLLQLILNYGKPTRFNHSSLRIVLFAGEVFPLQPLEKLRVLWSTAEFYNLYGPTETNVVTWYQVPSEIDPDLANLPIGKACPFAELRLWEEGFKEGCPGQKGELVAAGESVAAGYLNLPEKTSRAFFKTGGKTWYKTGDLVSINEAGEYVFIGRKDRMIKRRGYRIELAEIERALLLHEEIQEAAVVAYQNEKGQSMIKAFLSCKDTTEEPGFVALKLHCSKHLPLYMLPDSFIFINQFPKTSSHKVDYQSLKQLANG